MKCPEALVSFNIGIRGIFLFTTIIIAIGIPFASVLHEEKKNKKTLSITFSEMWQALSNRAVWQLMLFSLIFSSIISVENPAYMTFPLLISTATWIPMAQQGVGAVIVIFTLVVITTYGLGWSYRKV